MTGENTQLYSNPTGKPGIRVRTQILGWVAAIVVLSVMSSLVSLQRVTIVERQLRSINRISIPLRQRLARLKSDGEILRREMERRLGYSHWDDPHWKARLIPKWIQDLLGEEIDQVHDLVHQDGIGPGTWENENIRERWIKWSEAISAGYLGLIATSQELYRSLGRDDLERARLLYPKWISDQAEWMRKLKWAVAESNANLKKSFSKADKRMMELKSGLQMVLVVVIFVSLFILWFGERAIRPLGELTALAKKISVEGLTPEMRNQIPIIARSRKDEVSQLAREFRNMAVTVLEREKTVQNQNARLAHQNKQLKKMGEIQKKLQAAEHMAAVGRMSAQVAHEVRNPLHAIGLEAELALDEAQSNPSLKRSIKSILDSVERLETITENYLRMSRLSNGEEKKTQVAESVQSVISLYSLKCEKLGIKVDWEFDRQNHTVIMADNPILEQALGNLQGNAIQALEAQKNIKTDAEKTLIHWSTGVLKSGQVYLKISDSGPGLASEVEKRLFEPFVTTKADGTGLGLPFVKKVIEDHGGEIEYNRSEKWGGAEFTITLPHFVEGSNA